MSENTLRQRLCTLRRTLSVDEQHQAALFVAKQLADESFFVDASRIAAYWACHGELNPKPLLEHAWAMGKHVYLPILTQGCLLRFAPCQPDTPMRRNRFSIPEPDVSPTECLLPAQLDVVLTPLVAFDATGTRLGMGGGYYDRSFAFLLDPDYRGKRPYLVGFGYELQQLAQLERQSWDVPLDAVATEKALYRYTPSPSKNI